MFDIVFLPLEVVAEYSKDRISAKKVDASNYVGVDNLLQECLGKVDSLYVPQDGNQIAFRENDILIGNIRPYLKKAWLADCNGGTNGDVLTIRVNDDKWVTPKFLYYVLTSDRFFAYNMQNAKGAKMPRGNKEAIMKYTVPLPSMEKQERIVAVLDRFNSLCNNLSSGLPAEIEARKKQYEYYRDKLLSFEEVKLL